MGLGLQGDQNPMTAVQEGSEHAVRHCWTEARDRRPAGPGVAVRPTLLTHGLCPQIARIQSHPIIRLPTCLGTCRDHPCPERHLPVGFGEVTPARQK